MRIQVRTSQVAGSQWLRNYIERRLGFALGRFANVIRRVVVRVRDVNGPKGGHDKECRLVVTGAGLGSLVVSAVDADLGQAVDRASEAMDRAVTRSLKRSLQGRRQWLPEPA